MRRVLTVMGVVLLAAAALWRPVAVPVLVKFPTDLDQTTRYAGTFTVYVDQTTGAPLDAPVTLPLELERRIRTDPGQSGAHTVVVQELVTFRVAGTVQHETHQYVMDRRTMANRDDPRSWSYDSANVVDRAGTFRVNLPLGVDPGRRYPIWENEPGDSFTMTGNPDQPRVDRHGLSLVALAEVFGDVPVSERYRDELRAQGFALRQPFEALAAQLTEQGVDVEAALTTVAAASPAGADAVAAARTTRVPLRFFRFNDGHALVEPRTGAIVDLVVSDEGISATVDISPLADLRVALADASADPAVAALAAALDRLDEAPPTRVYLLHYGQTRASVAEVAALTRDELRQLDWAERYVPALLAATGAALLAVGVVTAAVARSARRREGDRDEPAAVPTGPSPRLDTDAPGPDRRRELTGAGRRR